MKRSSVIDAVLVAVGGYLILQFVVGIKELWSSLATGDGSFIIFVAVVPGLFGLFGAVCLLGVYYRRKNRIFKAKIEQS